MKVIIIVSALFSGLSFVLLIVILILGFIKKSKPLKLAALFLLAVFICSTAFTCFMIVKKITAGFKSRTGDEIYEALFGKRETDCVEILHHQDQVIPKIDDAIWLHFETCPEELKRVLSRHKYRAEKLSTDKWSEKIPHNEALKWFTPTLLGDTIMVYEYVSDDYRNIQTIWTTLDSTKVFVRDIFD